MHETNTPHDVIYDVVPGRTKSWRTESRGSCEADENGIDRTAPEDNHAAAKKLHISSQQLAGLSRSHPSLQETRHLDEEPRDFMKKVFGIGAENRQSGQPKSRLIWPHSPFGTFWILGTTVFLAYTAVVTPPIIASSGLIIRVLLFQRCRLT